MELDISQETAILAQQTRERYEALLAFLTNNIPHSRARAVAITELETSMMWAIKAIVVVEKGN